MKQEITEVKEISKTNAPSKEVNENKIAIEKLDQIIDLIGGLVDLFEEIIKR